MLRGFLSCSLITLLLASCGGGGGLDTIPASSPTSTEAIVLEPSATTSTIPAPTTTSPSVDWAVGTDDPWGPSAECNSYLVYRDFISGLGVPPDFDSYFDAALERVDAMMLFATGESVENLNAYRNGIAAIADLYTESGWSDPSSAEVAHVAQLVEEVQFDKAERAVWTWAADVCGLPATGCVGFLYRILEVRDFTSEYGFLIDPASCSFAASIDE